MKILRFVFPFLFVRNWHTGSFELSRPRFLLFLGFFGLLALGILAAYIAQAPVVYSTTV